MLEGLFRSLVPILLSTVGKTPMAIKRMYAARVITLMTAFLDGDRERFTLLISSVGVPDAMQTQAIEALFKDENQTG
jgi:hypothetical protein